MLRNSAWVISSAFCWNFREYQAFSFVLLGITYCKFINIWENMSAILQSIYGIIMDPKLHNFFGKLNSSPLGFKCLYGYNKKEHLLISQKTSELLNSYLGWQQSVKFQAMLSAGLQISAYLFSSLPLSILIFILLWMFTLKGEIMYRKGLLRNLVLRLCRFQ